MRTRRKSTEDINEWMQQTALQRLSAGVGETFMKNAWSDADFFDLVEKFRKRRRNKVGCRYEYLFSPP